MRGETDTGGGRGEFPRTRQSLVQRIGAGDPAERREAVGELVAIYWKPVYAYLRLRWRQGDEAAKDHTQGFFAAVWEKGYLADFDADRARFRTYLRSCLDRFVANDERARHAQRRGGDFEHESLDFAAAERDLAGREPPDPHTTDAWFEAEWKRSVLETALADLEREYAARDLDTRFAIFRRYAIEPTAPGERPTYAALAGELGLPTHAITNALAAARRDFQRLVLERLRAWTRDEDEFQAEVRALFGAGDVGT